MSKNKRPFGWDDAKSIALSKFATLAMGVICVVMVFCGPQLVGWAMRDYTGPNPALPRVLLLGLGYLCAALALATLCQLYRLLGRIGRGAVFVRANVTALRRISWCCAWAAVLCLPAGLWLRLPFVFALGLGAGFMALIVRVIKNAFEQAVSMKDELDFTI